MSSKCELNYIAIDYAIMLHEQNSKRNFSQSKDHKLSNTNIANFREFKYIFVVTAEDRQIDSPD